MQYLLNLERSVLSAERAKLAREGKKKTKHDDRAPEEPSTSSKPMEVATPQTSIIDGQSEY